MDYSLLPFNFYIGGYVLLIIYTENITYKFKDANGNSENIVKLERAKSDEFENKYKRLSDF